MARFYANENFPLPAVEALRKLGHEVITTAEVGQSDKRIPDDEVLRFANAQKLTVLTLNRRDFIRLHRSNPDHAGIVVCTFNPDFIAFATRVHEAVSAYSTLDGQLVRVNRPAT